MDKFTASRAESSRSKQFQKNLKKFLPSPQILGAMMKHL
jgi:hypothetical protein